MWQALAGYLGSNTTASPGAEGETLFLAETYDRARIRVYEQIDLGGSSAGYENQSANRKSCPGIARRHKGRAPAASHFFDSIKDLSDALIRAKEAHSEFERASGAEDYNWPLWYAAYIATEQGVAEKSTSKLAWNPSFARFRKCAAA
jgi:hypothetical protein